MDPTQAVSVLDQRMDFGARAWMSAGQVAGVPVLEAKLPGAFRACFTTRVGAAGARVGSLLDLDSRSETDPQTVAVNRALIEKAVGRRW